MRWRTLITLLLATVSFSTSLVNASATRVAMLCAGDKEVGSDVLMLAEARLHREPAVTLLDRGEVERVLHEQKLKLWGVADSESILAVGKILRVEVFVVLEMLAHDKEPLGLVAFDAQTGVRLQDVAFPKRGLEQTAQSVANTVTLACAKRGSKPDKLKNVCLLPVRNADLPRAMDSRCQAVAALLERSLTRSEGVAVLERSRLEHVNKERKLPTASDGGDLAASLLTIDLEVGRGTSGKGLRGMAWVSDAGGKRLAEAKTTVPEEDVAALASSLHRELLKVVRMAEPARAIGDRVAEARRFCHASQLLEEQQDTAASLAAAESASALDPTTPLWTGQVALTLLKSALVVLDPREVKSYPWPKCTASQWERAYELALRALDLREENRNKEDDARLKDDVESRLFLAVTHLCIDQNLGFFCSRIRESLAQQQRDAMPTVLRFGERYRGYMVPLLMKQADECVTDERHLVGFLGTWGGFDFRGLDAASSPHEYVADLTLISSRFLESWRQLGVKEGDADWNRHFCHGEPWCYNRALCFCIPDRDFVRSQLSRQDQEKLTALFESMRRHPVVLVREYGMLGQVWLAQWCGEAAPSFAAFKQFVRKQIERSGESADRERRFHYAAMEDAVSHLKLDGAQRRRERLELLQYMLNRNEIVGNPANGNDISTIVMAALDELAFSPGEAVKWIERVEAVLNGNVRLVMHGGGGDFVPRMKYCLNHRRRNAECSLPESSRSVPSPPWKRARPLIRRANFDAYEKGLVSPVIYDDSLLVVDGRGRGDNSDAEAFCVPLNSTEGPRSLGKISGHVHASIWPWAVEASCAGGGYYFVCVDEGMERRNGNVPSSSSSRRIVGFPLSGGDGRRIEARGLPSKHVQAMAWLDGDLYVALNDGYIVRCDLHGGPHEILASSRRKQHLSPFDDGPLFSVPYLAADPKRHRLLCAISIPSSVSYIDERRWTSNGLWQYDPAKKSFQQILKIGSFSKPICGGSRICGDSFLLWCHDVALRVDLKTDKANVLFANFSGYEIVPGIKTDAAIYRNIPVACGGYAEADGWLWTSWESFVRVSKEGKLEQLPLLDAKMPVAGYQYLKSTTDGLHLVVGNRSSIWLLTLRD